MTEKETEASDAHSAMLARLGTEGLAIENYCYWYVFILTVSAERGSLVLIALWSFL